MRSSRKGVLNISASTATATFLCGVLRVARGRFNANPNQLIEMEKRRNTSGDSGWMGSNAG